MLDDKESRNAKQQKVSERSNPGSIRFVGQAGIPLLILFASLAFLALFILAQSGEAAQEIIHEVRSESSSVGSPDYGVDFITSAENLADDQQIANGLATGAGWDRWPIYWFYVETSEGIAVIPVKDGYIFQPQMRELRVPPGAPYQNFLAIPLTPTPEPYPGP